MGFHFHLLRVILLQEHGGCRVQVVLKKVPMVLPLSHVVLDVALLYYELGGHTCAVECLPRAIIAIQIRALSSRVIQQMELRQISANLFVMTSSGKKSHNKYGRISYVAYL